MLLLLLLMLLLLTKKTKKKMTILKRPCPATAAWPSSSRDPAATAIAPLLHAADDVQHNGT
jgi:hypothetical protein